MKVATWNVNSLRARMPRLEIWLAENQPDIFCMQETKVSDEGFPHLAFQALGYETVAYGLDQWNGVAIASKVGIEDRQIGFGEEARLVTARCGEIRVGSVYVPNGRLVGSEHYVYKLDWLAQLADWVGAREPGEPMILCGDFNIAPDDRDVWNAAEVNGGTHVSPEERAALSEILKRGLVDAFRLHHDEGAVYSWWDYRAGDFHKGKGMRIDLMLLTEDLAERCLDARIDRNARKGKPAPSDHAPMIIELAD